MRRNLRVWYARKWRTVTRPAILLRAGGRFDGGQYRGAAKCFRCGHIDCMHGGRSELDVAHLVIQPGDPGHDEDTNLSALCRPCHRAHDYQQWARLHRAWLQEQRRRRLARKDAARPILEQIELEDHLAFCRALVAAHLTVSCEERHAAKDDA